MINVTWTPPNESNGIIYQYTVERVNSSGKFYDHVSADAYSTLLPLFNETHIFVAAVNLYGKGIPLLARSEGMYACACTVHVIV